MARVFVVFRSTAESPEYFLLLVTVDLREPAITFADEVTFALHSLGGATLRCSAEDEALSFALYSLCGDTIRSIVKRPPPSFTLHSVGGNKPSFSFEADLLSFGSNSPGGNAISCSGYPSIYVIRWLTCSVDRPFSATKLGSGSSLTEA